MPIRLPKKNGNSTEMSPICRSRRALYAIRLQMSRPKLSVPSTWPGLSGGRNASVKRCSIGSYGVRSGAKIAASTTIVSSTTPVTKAGLSWVLRRRTAMSIGFGATTGSAPPSSALSLIRDPRVEDRVGKVDDEVDQDHEECADHRDGLHDGVVPPADGRDQELSRARDREHCLDDDRAADEEAELQTEDRDGREQGVPQHVA